MADSKLVRYMELVRDLQDNPMEGASGISTADFLPQVRIEFALAQRFPSMASFFRTVEDARPDKRRGRPEVRMSGPGP